MASPKPDSSVTLDDIEAAEAVFLLIAIDVGSGMKALQGICAAARCWRASQTPIREASAS